MNLSRREMIQIGGSSLLGLGLPELLRADAVRQGRKHADACIILFLDGGPSHLDMWDMKPDAPKEVRGEFKPIATTVPGVQLGEHLPRLARLVQYTSIVRSAHHSVNNSHAAAVYAGLTGHDRGENGGGAKPTDYPAIGSVVGHIRPPAAPVVPYVSLPYITKEGAGGPPQPGFFGGWMGRASDPLFVLRNPNAPSFAMPELTPRQELAGERLDRRLSLVKSLEKGTGQDLEAFRAKAFDLLTATATQKAFRLDQEAAKVRDGYGRNIYGQSVLLARRLIEAGTRVVCISWAPDANATWDTHGNNFGKLKNELLPQLDMALSSLLGDLDARKMLDRTLVAVMGEFGRSPKVNAGAGRDHWNFCYGLMLAGGGIKGGYVHGASDRIGAYPSRNPVGPADVIATIYHCLGVPHDLEMRDRLNRPYTLVPWGSPIGELLD